MDGHEIHRGALTDTQPDSIVGALNEVRIAITEMKRFIKLTPEIGYIFEKGRKDVEQYDEKFPVDPKWV